MSKIYLVGCPIGSGRGMVNGSTVGGDIIGYALAEDGRCLAQHLSSDVDWSKHDMGLTSDWKHDVYAKHYPEGYELMWIEDVTSSPEWKAAMLLNKQIYQAEKGGEDTDE